VSDANGEPVQDLEKGAFRLRDNGDEQTIENLDLGGEALSFGVVRYVDPSNTAKWSSAANCTMDLGVCIEGAISDLPTKTIHGSSYPWGTIYVAAGDYVLVTPVVPGPLVSIEMAGPNAVRITSTINGDAFVVRDSPFNDNRGSSIGGFTLIGPGSGHMSAVGIHTGDLNFAHFHDIAIGGFTGDNSSCFWVDDQAGWFERNMIEHVSLGEVQTATGNQSLGCAKYVRFTGNSSFGYNEWLGLRLALGAGGQIGFSVEGGSLYQNHITGNANVVPGTDLFSISGSGGGDNSFIDFRAECTGCVENATGWSVASGLSYSYTGPGIVTGQDPHIVDSIAGNLVPMLTSDIKQSAYAAGAKMLWIPTLPGEGSSQINEAIGIGDNQTSWGSGIGAVQGSNVAHPIVWGYVEDANCFEAYSKNYRTPLTSSNRIATLPCHLGNSAASFVLDNAKQDLTNKTMVSPTITGSSTGAGVQGRDPKLLTAGTVQGTGASLCLDAQGGATTSGCASEKTYSVGHLGTGSCATAAEAYSTCTSIVTIAPAQPDLEYMPFCTGISPSSTHALIQTASATSPTSITATVVTEGHVAVRYRDIWCVAIRP
jgi:hypothetical protein